jgi:hypothetical protein
MDEQNNIEKFIELQIENEKYKAELLLEKKNNEIYLQQIKAKDELYAISIEENTKIFKAFTELYNDKQKGSRHKEDKLYAKILKNQAETIYNQAEVLLTLFSLEDD